GEGAELGFDGAVAGGGSHATTLPANSSDVARGVHRKWVEIVKKQHGLTTRRRGHRVARKVHITEGASMTKGIRAAAVAACVAAAGFAASTAGAAPPQSYEQESVDKLDAANSVETVRQLAVDI